MKTKINRQELKNGIDQMYAGCTGCVWVIKQTEKGGVRGTSYRHPIQRKIIEVWENKDSVLCVLVYDDTNNAKQRNAIECNTIEDFARAIC